MQYTGECVVPWKISVGGPVMTRHVARYAWAILHCANKHVIDLGSGTGYGSFMLSWVARMVTGLEKNADCVFFAQENFDTIFCRYRQADITVDAIPQADVYVAFEILEHLDSPHRLIGRLPPGKLLWSMPVNDISQFHKRGYSVSQIDYLMGRGGWFQAGDGLIVPRDRAWFAPNNVIGMREV